MLAYTFFNPSYALVIKHKCFLIKTQTKPDNFDYVYRIMSIPFRQSLVTAKLFTRGWKLLTNTEAHAGY